MQPDGHAAVGAPIGIAERVPVLDRLIARMEVSRTYPFPVFSFLLLWSGIIGFEAIARVTGTQHVLAARFYGAAWLLVVILELGRDMWAQRHRYASLRWVRAVDAAVGKDVAVHALADLVQRHQHESDYVVTRADLRSAVQREKARRRDTSRRAEGVRLVKKPIDTGLQADTERRRRARERRAARRVQQLYAPGAGRRRACSR